MSGDEVAALVDKVRAIEDALQPLLSTPLDTITDGLDDEELARLNLVMAYTLNSLFYMFLKTQNVSPAGHPVRKELQRVQGYIEKLKAAAAQRKAAASTPAAAVSDGDKAAAQRLVQSLSSAAAAAAAASQPDILELPSGDAADGDAKKAKKKKKKKSKKGKRDRQDE